LKHIPILLIGGVGRSGTNLLRSILNNHSEVYSHSFETRFTIDPDGVIPTYVLLKEGWSPFVSERAIERLDVLLNKLSHQSILDILAIAFGNLFSKFGLNGNIKAYKEWQLEKMLPNFRYHNTKLIKNIKLLEYKGTWAGRTGSMSGKAINKVGFSNNKNKLNIIFNEYFHNLYKDLLSSKKKSLYVEDNTFNILYANYYEKLLPGSLMVHMIRDPRDVIASYINQRWCPKNLKVAIKYYIELMERWLEVKKELNTDFYIEIKLENLCENTSEVLHNLTDKLDIELEKDLLNNDLSKSNTGRWIKEFDESEQKILNDRLFKYIEYFDYI